MPLCPQITNTPITVTQTADFTVSSVLPVVVANTQQLAAIDADVAAAVATANAAAADADAAQADATEALADAATAYTAAIGSLQPSASTIVNASNQMTAINSGGITVYSGASATSGARVVLNSAGLAGFNSGGSATFSISASTGAAVFSGSVTGSTITGGTLNIAGNAIIDASGLLTATGATITGTINATAGYFGTASNGFSISSTGLVGVGTGIIVGGTITTSSGSASVSLVGSSNSVTFKNGGSNVAHIVPLSSNGVLIHYGATANPSGGTFPQMFVGSANVSMFASSTIGVGISTSVGVTVAGTFSTDGAATFGTTNSFQYLSGGTLRSLFTYTRQVTSSVRTLLIDSAGNIGQASSTRRNKHEIEPYRINSQALLNLDVKTFKYTPELSPEQSVQYGFIAEEAADLGLDELVQYDETGIPSYFSYEKLPIFLLQLVQELKAEIDTLKGE